MGYDLGLIAIPISVFVSTTGCSVFYAYTAIPKSNFNESLV
jgi:hypothetical protein